MTTATRPVTVASVPHDHVYVRHLARPDEVEPAVVRLPDPRTDARAEQSTWWPPAMLSAEWVRASELDLMHVQFGFDARTPDQLRELVRALRETGRPLVQTVHDLRNPHHLDRSLHDAQLDVLVPAADALLTLTPSAAAEVRSRWGREAIVVPHPHVVDLDRMARVGPRAPGPFRVGLHVKSLRASMDPVAVLPALAAAVRRVGGVLQVNGHPDVLSPTGASRDDALLDVLAGLGDVLDLRVHDFMDHDAFVDHLEALDVSVLPYRFGTHSGWLEACRDVGTHVVAPTCGSYAEQGPVHSYVLDEHRFDPASLVDAVLSAHAAGPATPLDPAWRRAQREEVAALHESVYRSVLA